MFRYKYIALFLVGTSLWAVPPQGDQAPQGWLWYEDPVLPMIEEKQETQEKKDAIPLSSAPKTSVERLAKVSEKFEEAKALAILEPTLENVAAAQKSHNAILEQATLFQKSWGLVEMLDQEAPRIPTSPGSIRLNRVQQKEEMTAALKDLSKDYGLIFAFKSDCPYCHQFAPLVQEFAQKYGFKVQGLSKGEGCFDGMTCSKNSQALQAINPKGSYPMLYLANPKTNDVIPIARGYIGLDALMSNINYALAYLKKEGTS